jgi:hypothetical protein
VVVIGEVVSGGGGIREREGRMKGGKGLLKDPHWGQMRAVGFALRTEE